MDWVDIMLHVVATIAIMAIALALTCVMHLHPMYLALAVSMFWFAREVWQDIRKGHNPPWPVRFSTQKWAEFVAPAITALVIAMLAGFGAIPVACNAS